MVGFLIFLTLDCPNTGQKMKVKSTPQPRGGAGYQLQKDPKRWVMRTYF